MQKNELPPAWASTKVGDICNLLNGRAYKKDELLEKGKYRVLRVGNLFTNPHWFYSDLELEDNKYCDQGDLLYAWSASFGPYIWDGNKVIYHYHIWKVEFTEELISKKFLRAYFDWDKEVIKREQGSGSTMIHVTKKSMEERSIPLPPLNEQRRIADKLDTTLAAVEACKQKLNNAAETIQRFRQSVLEAAVSGELTREWRKERGIEGEWKEITAKEAGKIQLGRQRSPKYHSGQTMRPYLRVQNVFEDRIDLEDVMTMDFPGKDLEKYKLHYGDILLNEGQSPQYLGRPAMYRDELDEACFTNTLIRFQANKQIVNPDFALLVFRHNMHVGRYISEGKITTNIAHLSLGRFGETEFPLPSLDEQEQVSNKAADLFAQANSIEAAITSALRAIGSLSSSVLAKAFRGELVPQDPNDEAAAVLLERIKAQREAEPAAKKPAKRGRKKKADAAQLAIPEGIADNHLAKVLEECGALSERALLAASELEPAVFQLQLTKELKAGGLKQVDVDGEAAYAHAAWEEEE